MEFTGTLDKCKACDKTVYFVDLLSADGVTYHKSCFKCSHCKGTLVVSDSLGSIPFSFFSLFFGFLCDQRIIEVELYSQPFSVNR